MPKFRGVTSDGANGLDPTTMQQPKLVKQSTSYPDAFEPSNKEDSILVLIGNGEFDAIREEIGKGFLNLTD